MGLGPFERSRELITRYDLLLRFALFPLTIEKEREEERRERRGRIGSSREPRFTEGSVPLFYFAFTSSPPLLFFSFLFLFLGRSAFFSPFFRPLSNFAFLSFALCLRLPLCFVFLGRSFYIFPFRFSSQLLFIYTSSNCRFGLYIV